MISLQRTVRFAAVPPEELPAALANSTNGYSGRPSLRDWGRHYELHIRCVGEVDPVVDYLLDIKEIDRAARATIIPAICGACFPTELAPPPAAAASQSPGHILQRAFPAFNHALNGMVKDVRLNLSPYYSIEMSTTDQSRVLLRQRFDFAAAHRLHVSAFSAAENVKRFGKCNNPKGHGHNYQIEPCISVRLASDGAHQFSLADLEALVEKVIIARFDHMHLNEDTTEFSANGGVLPTVENIAKVSYELLRSAVAEQASGVALHSVTVWETDRTSATYPA